MKSDSVVTERGQVTLPRLIRSQLGLVPGTKVTFILSPEGLLIRKAVLRSSPIREVFGVLKDGVRTDNYLRQIRGKVE